MTFALAQKLANHARTAADRARRASARTTAATVARLSQIHVRIGGANRAAPMLAAGLCLLAAGQSRPAVDPRLTRLAVAAERGFSAAALDALRRDMDPAMAALARRHDAAESQPAPRDFFAAVEASDAPPLGAAGPPVDAAAALRLNAVQPFAAGPNPAARPFFLTAASPADRARAQRCLAEAVYYEAGFEPLEGARAVAQVVLNRVRHSAFPKSVCGVVFQGATRPGCQFTFACDGSMSHAPVAPAWRRAQQVAAQALNGYVMPAVGSATFYHANYVAPAWAPRLSKIRLIGAHIFYRWPGAWGSPQAFTGRYDGREPGFRPSGRNLFADGSAALQLAALDAAAVEGPPERRAPNDLGGRIIVGTGWTPRLPPTSGASTLASVLSTQGDAPPAQGAPAGS